MKLVTWNTQWCCGLDGVVSARRIVDGARALADFDVLCLQEIAQGYRGLRGAPGDQPAELAALLPGFQVFFGAAVDEFAADGTRQRFGNLIATRLPVLQVQQHALPWPADGGVPSMPRMCSVLTLRDPRLGALRVMTTHLEYYSRLQRTAQARALVELHAQACARAAAPPADDDDPGSPFQAKTHTPQAVLCGDFNLEAHEPEYALIAAGGLRDAWRLLHGDVPQPPTFRLFDRSCGPTPAAFDFVFVSPELAPRVRRFAVDGLTQASDHQPVALHLE
ncbi:MAG TPA: endonuclease/exonuclease/phosphatase family protein [Rubrivivax sp.]|nr:endonuclease/exonuclease/phosphatase family protein [Rubrivivax sp.]